MLEVEQAPEVILQSGTPDVKSDIWSLGKRGLNIYDFYTMQYRDTILQKKSEKYIQHSEHKCTNRGRQQKGLHDTFLAFYDERNL